MTSLQIAVVLDYALPHPHDVLIQIEAAHDAQQLVRDASLFVTSPERLRAVPGEDAIGQRTWARGVGRIRCDYRATVDIVRDVPLLETLAQVPVADCPADVVPYLLPSRYVPSDRFEGFVARRFGGLRGGAAAAAMRDWIAGKIAYAANASTGVTNALDTFVTRAGVCRDYAHLMAGFARAAMIPARVVSVYAPDVQPQDFHAVTELWLDNAWHLVDSTGMAIPQDIARVVVGRDATDIAFMTIFGTATLIEQTVAVTRA